jgi:hypothetical protein
MYLFKQKNGLGNILGDFSAKQSGHPGGAAQEVGKAIEGSRVAFITFFIVGWGQCYNLGTILAEKIRKFRKSSDILTHSYNTAINAETK